MLLLTASFCIMMAASAAAADPAVASGARSHTVQKGETLYAIARRYDVSVEALMSLNGIADAGKLFVGMKLTIPGGPGAVASLLEYVVKKGDTLYGIAKAHGVAVADIVKASGMTTTTIKIGQTLRIPATSTAASVASPSSPVPASVAPASGTAAGAKPAAATGQSWPVAGAVSYLQGKLKGVSISAESASAITAVRSGTVISAGPFRGFGLVAYVQAGDGMIYVYGGAAALSVKLGDSVRKGSLIGKLSSDGDASAYFFVFDGADTIDPASAPRD